MERRFSISEAARMAGMTSETLRHYDRIGLVKPSYTDESTGYRYYSPREIVRLSAVQALRLMDLSLGEIAELLDCSSADEIISRLRQAEMRADDRIAQLIHARERIRRARADYESRAAGHVPRGETYVCELPERVILLSETMREPTLDNLWDYQRPFYSQLPPELRDRFAFEDMAGIYERNGQARLFAVCTQYTQVPGMLTLPAGQYLCADCTEADRLYVRKRLFDTARAQGYAPDFAVELVVLTGILQWKYQAQVFLRV